MQQPGGSAEEDERIQVFRALAVCVARQGQVSLADVAAQADVSPRRLQRQYADVEACYLDAFERCSRWAGSVLVRAYAGEHGWVEAVRSALTAALELIEREPDLARLWIVYALGAGPRVLRSRAKTIATLAEYIDRGRREARVRAEPPAITAEGVVGALLVVLQTRLLAAKRQPLEQLRGELMSLILLPYLGGAAARRELARPAGSVSRGRRAQPPGGRRELAEGVGKRVTYRTARVLTAIAERPGSSNREVANRAEVVDQGQISKLLTRLEAQGLIVNAADGSGVRGAPNAWELTLRGEQIQHSLAGTVAPREPSGRGTGRS
ncbi:MAG TPA: helix-turn-helix domain-containing protein [Solirubrobacteraceae bacterium]|nr:helix-turn-helix domain-containing protein [Solirubrobacteraceae bacterium]